MYDHDHSQMNNMPQNEKMPDKPEGPKQTSNQMDMNRHEHMDHTEHADHRAHMDMSGSHSGHDGHNHHQMMVADFKRRFVVSLSTIIVAINARFLKYSRMQAAGPGKKAGVRTCVLPKGRALPNFRLSMI